jgi:hypothetical protein
VVDETLTPTEQARETSDAANGLEVFAAYGMCLFGGAQLQHVLGTVYALTFDDPRSGSAPRVDEKLLESFDATLGALNRLAAAANAIPPDLVDDVEAAVRLRNYVAHSLPMHCRRLLGTPEGMEELAGRLNVVTTFFTAVIGRLNNRIRELVALAGIAGDQIEAGFAPWHQLGDPFERTVRLPEAEEQIVRGWYTRSRGRPQYYVENAAGVVWQLVEVGLADARLSSGPDWAPWHALTPHLPARITSRPRGAAFRGPFNYDLRIGTGGVRLEVSRPAGADAVTLDLLDGSGRSVWR